MALIVGVMISVTAASQSAIPVTIEPIKATVYVGETQTFTAIIHDAKGGIKWSIREKNGGRISDEGEYTAARDIGIYHIVASGKADGAVKAVATVTVVQHSDPPSDSK